MCNQAPVRTTAAPSTEPAKAPLPLEQMPGSTVATVKDTKGKVAARGALVRYATNQAYFVLQQLDESLQNKAVVVSTPGPQRAAHHAHRSGLRRAAVPLALAHCTTTRPSGWSSSTLIDNLAETTLGRQNLELKKNVTIDLFDADSDAYLRDRAGFMVTDREQFHQLTVQSNVALPVLRTDKDVTVEKFAAAELQDLIDFDNTLSAQTRPDYLEFLTSKCKEEENEDDKEKLNIHGYIVANGDRVLGLYAKTAEIADTLLAAYIRETRVKTVSAGREALQNKSRSLSAQFRGHWRYLENLPHTTQRFVYRRHTRAVPSNVKWNRIFAVNVGMNLF
ncbi:hypothetical protein M3Y99_01399400 [Aphelenchoides fujianensis]|nr:hypothetical protein M3Y99_01399400 [Aphelenchoides fujianensis]